MSSVSDALDREISISGYSEYYAAFPSSLFQPGTDIPVEIVLQLLSKKKDGVMVLGAAMRRVGGCLMIPVTKVRVTDEDDLDWTAIRKVLNNMFSSAEKCSALGKVLPALEDPDPYELPQRSFPDLIEYSSDLEPVSGVGTDCILPAFALTIRDKKTDIHLWVDIIYEVQSKRSHLRVWAEWPHDKGRHLVCYLDTDEFGYRPNEEDVLAFVINSKDFLHRIHHLHDRWRTSHGLRSVSTPAQMKLLPIQDDTPKPPPKGLFRKPRKRR